MNILRPFTALAIAMLLPHSTYAQRLDSIHTLQDVAVVGVRPHYLTPSQTLKGSMLQNLSTTSVADALKYFSGVQIKDYGGLGGLKTINVRSLGSQHVGVYLDGIRINNAQNGQIDLGRYSLSNMESVSLYNANRNERLQSASEYASAATVYMQTKRPTETTYTLEYGNGSFGLNKLKGYFALKTCSLLTPNTSIPEATTVSASIRNKRILPEPGTTLILHSTELRLQHSIKACLHTSTITTLSATARTRYP